MAHLSFQAPEVHDLIAGMTRGARVDFTEHLEEGELLAGTPVVTELTNIGLTFSNLAISIAELTINGRKIPAGKALQLRITAPSVTKEVKARVKLEVDTDSTPTNNLLGVIILKIRPVS